MGGTEGHCLDQWSFPLRDIRTTTPDAQRETPGLLYLSWGAEIPSFNILPKINAQLPSLLAAEYLGTCLQIPSPFAAEITEARVKEGHISTCAQEDLAEVLSLVTAGSQVTQLGAPGKWAPVRGTGPCRTDDGSLRGCWVQLHSAVRGHTWHPCESLPLLSAHIQRTRAVCNSFGLPALFVPHSCMESCLSNQKASFRHSVLLKAVSYISFDHTLGL